MCSQRFQSLNILRLSLVSLFVASTFFVHGQKVGYHKNRIKKAESDTSVINSYNYLAEYYLYQNNDSAAYYIDRSIRFSNEKRKKSNNFKAYYLSADLELINGDFEKAISQLKIAEKIAEENDDFGNRIDALILKGNINQQQQKDKLALECYLNAYNESKKKKYNEGILSSGIYLGLYYKGINENTNSLKYYLQIYPIAIKLKDTSSIFNCCINIGTLYERTKDPEKAVEFYRHALNIIDPQVDENAKAIGYFKIGRVYAGMGVNDSAEIYLMKTMEIHLKRNDELGLIFDYSYLASVNAEQKDYQKAVENYNRSLELAYRQKDSTRISMVYDYIGAMYYKNGDYQKALDNYKYCLDFATKKISPETLLKIYEKTSEIHKKLGHYKEALEHHEIFKAWADSLYNAKDIKTQTELKLGFEFNQVEEKMKADAEKLKADAKTKELINQAESEKEKQKRYYLMGGLILVSILLIMAIRNFINKQKANKILLNQKKEIELQKKIVDEKNREISDSINYAHHIQNACLPEKSELMEWFPKYSVIYKPKDVVSGDFYWSSGSENQVFIAVADCTGHGVPGAITSMIGSMLLNEIFYVKKITRPDEVLTELNRLVRLTLRQKETSVSKDGMDMAFCCWDKKTNKLLFSGANRPLYIIRSGGSVEEIKPTKISIGGFTSLLEEYVLHEVQLNKGDTVIMSSDGYADQFGGEKEKKFTTKYFKNLLVEIANEEVENQKLILEEKFSKWKKGFSQTDDILIFLFKI